VASDSSQRSSLRHSLRISFSFSTQLSSPNTSEEAVESEINAPSFRKRFLTRLPPGTDAWLEADEVEDSKMANQPSTTSL